MMCSNYYWSTFVVGVAMTLPLSAYSAQPVNLKTSSFQQLQQDFHLKLPHSSKTIVPENDADHALQYVRERTDQNQVTHIRMQQAYLNFPVFRGYAIIHSKKPTESLMNTHQDVSMNGVIYKNLENDLGKPPASFVKNAASVLQQFKSNYTGVEMRDEQVTPMVYIDEHQKAHWAYQVSVFVEYNDKMPEQPTAIISAETQAPFLTWNEVKTIRAPARAIGYGGNEKYRQYEFGQDFPYLVISRDDDKEMCFMENEGVKVVDMEHTYFHYNRPMRFHCKTANVVRSNIYRTGYHGDGYDLDNGAYSPTNDALYAGYVINRMYQKWYGVPALTKAGKPMQLVMRVHYGKGYENAFWDGKQMTFGDGDFNMHPLVSLGVSAHEISHGFTQQHSNLAYFGESGGMNEAFSDMAAQAAEFYARRSSTWKIGSDIVKQESGYKALRFMRKPSVDGRSIDRADEYYNGLNVHYSSGVYNRLFYLMAHKSGWNTRKAFDVMVKANMDYWTPYSTFEEGGCGILSATKDIGLSVADVKESLDEVAIKYDNCGESVLESSV